MIMPQQIRGARAMLGLTQAELAKRAGISTTGLNNIESGTGDPKASTLAAIKNALESAGIEFIAENGGGAGVRLRKGGAPEAEWQR
jgi:predicted transcriptional regulator